MTPAVSVVIATHNYGRYLGGALESALGQSFGDLEVIVVDDGSTDGSDEVVRRYLRDGRVRYCRTDHLGQPRAKNTGIRLARAPLLAFLDADDLWLPEKLERQMALLRDDPDVGVVYCPRRVIDADGRELDFRYPEPLRGWVLGPIFHTNFVCFSSCVVRRGVLDVVGGFDEGLELAIDYDLWLRAARHFRFDYVPEALVAYRVGHGSLSSRAVERGRAVRFIMNRFLRERGGRDALDPALVRLALAEHYCDQAAIRPRQPTLPLLGWYLRALGYRPWHYPAWRGALTCWWPTALRARVRRALGLPDWEVPRLKAPALATGRG
jgi:glycosyltransferase involved in cell wall biosynthesis